MQNVELCIKGSEKKYIGNCEMAMLLMSQGDVFKNGESETFRGIEIEVGLTLTPLPPKFTATHMLPHPLTHQHHG